jgi:hypothetical protein
MSDFLTNLSVRAAGSADAIQPRLAFLFEPPQTVFGSMTAPSSFPQEMQQEAFEEAVSQSDAHETVAHDRINRLPTLGPSLVEVPGAELKAEMKPAWELLPSDPLAPNRSPIPSRGEVSLGPVAAPALPKFPASELESSSPVSASVASIRSGQEIREGRRGETPLDPAAAPAFPRFRDSESGVSLMSSQSLVREPVAPFLPIRSGQQIGEGTPQSRATYSYKAAIGPPGHPAEKESSFTDDPVRSGSLTAPRIDSSYLPPNYFSQPPRSAIEPRLAPRSAEVRRSAASSQFKPAEPTIQVTIGRIEVRATAQPPSARRERTASPVMSLDEYLRSREKRGGQ